MFNKNNLVLIVAIANVLVFGVLFTLMNYYELLGADTSYFDEGSLNNIAIINKVLTPLSLAIDPNKLGTVSTLKYALFFGLAMLSTFVSIVVANRREDEYYEVTELEVKA
jgi:hypothetical protein